MKAPTGQFKAVELIYVIIGGISRILMPHIMEYSVLTPFHHILNQSMSLEDPKNLKL